jgi:hypothetical protein
MSRIPVDCFRNVLKKHGFRVYLIEKGAVITIGESVIANSVAAEVAAKFDGDNWQSRFDHVMIKGPDHPRKCYPVRNGTVSSSLCHRFAHHNPTFGIAIEEFFRPIRDGDAA